MQEQTKLEKFLPIGTIVLLKNGKKPKPISPIYFEDNNESEETRNE